MKVRVLFFATLKEKTKQSRMLLDLPGDAATLQDVKTALAQRFPAAADNLAIALAAINEEYAFPQDSVADGDEIAFFPPVSGGEEHTPYPTITRLADTPIDHDALIQSITISATGAVVVFSGMVRGETRRDGGGTQATQHLEYEAYESMATTKMQQVANEIRQKWPLVQGVAIVQRVGRLDVGQNTILIACSSGHRGDGCFEAARYGIDRLKEIVPVWKREVRPDGSAWVEGGYVPTPKDRASSDQ